MVRIGIGHEKRRSSVVLAIRSIRFEGGPRRRLTEPFPTKTRRWDGRQGFREKAEGPVRRRGGRNLMTGVESDLEKR